MANFEEKVTSNFFKVKDSKLFINEIEEKEIECFFERKYNDNERFAIASYDGLMTVDKYGEDFEYDDFIKLIQNHIYDDEIVVIKSIGNEALRYLTADVAIVSKEKVEYIEFGKIIKNKLINEYNLDDEEAANISY